MEILIVSGMKRPASSDIPDRGVFLPKPYDTHKITETLMRMAA